MHKKACLKNVALEMAATIVARKRHRREQRARGKRENIFSTRNLFGNQEEYENIICQAMLFFICFRK